MSESNPIILAIDIETTIDEKYGPAPQYYKNRGIHYGVLAAKLIPETPLQRPLIRDCAGLIKTWIDNLGVNIITGHNIKFDLLYLMKTYPYLLQTIIEKGIIVWDTQLAAYLFSGQVLKTVSLDQLSGELGLPLKDDEIKEYFKRGIGADKIPEEKIIPYLQQDVTNTLELARSQIHSVENRFPFFISQMDALLAITEMEYNGMYIDAACLDDLMKKTKHYLDDTEKRIIKNIRTQLPNKELPAPVELNLSSNKLISNLLYGGEYKVQYREPMLDKYNKPVHYKSGKNVGQPRYKIVEVAIPFPGIANPPAEHETKTPGIYKVDEDVLTDLLHQATKGKLFFTSVPEKARVVSLLADLIKHRRLKKEYSTYLVGLKEVLFPDSRIYGTINQCVTSTGRTSSSKPNLQNLPSGDDSNIKSMFTSRWGDDGVIVEADYKQLEVIALALITQDKQLCDDIKKGRDVHTETGKEVYGPMMGHDERRIVKGVNFGIIYGAGANTLAKTGKIPIELAKKLMDAFYNRYPNVHMWQTMLSEELRTRTPVFLTGKTLPNGLPQHAVQYEVPTGRLLTFNEYVQPCSWKERNNHLNLSPTEMKNYPPQSLATGDIVPMMCGVVLRALIKNQLYDKVKMINTVHDSLVFDVHKDVLNEALILIKHTLESVPKHLSIDLGITTDLPFRVDISYGPNWKDQKTVDN